MDLSPPSCPADGFGPDDPGRGAVFFLERLLDVCLKAGCHPSSLPYFETRFAKCLGLQPRPVRMEEFAPDAEGVDGALVLADGFSRALDRIDLLDREAVTDPLTGLFNRRYFLRQLELEAEKARRAEEPFTLLLLDVDHFKLINDTYGHPEGDRVLKRVAEILIEKSRKIDVAVRYGGEEFALLLPFTGMKSAIVAAERIRLAVRREAFFPDSPRRVTVSIGLASFSYRRPESPLNVVARADVKLYEAKTTGRDRVCAHEEDDGRAATEVTADERAGLFGPMPGEMG